MGWESYQAILDEAREITRQEAVRVPLSCPNDGQPLVAGPHGGVFCEYDGWRPE